MGEKRQKGNLSNTGAPFFLLLKKNWFILRQFVFYLKELFCADFNHKNQRSDAVK